MDRGGAAAPGGLKFGIDRILSPELGAPKERPQQRPVDGYLRWDSPAELPSGRVAPVPLYASYERYGEPVYGGAPEPYLALVYPICGGIYPGFCRHCPAGVHQQPCCCYGYPQAPDPCIHQPPQQTPPRPRTRTRTMFTDRQLQFLEDLYRTTKYPTAERRAELAEEAGLSPEAVRVWFKNRRARRKHQ
ncbi:dharma [Pholidichthys leucotaenia]